MSDVYFADARSPTPRERIFRKLETLFQKSGIADTISKGDTVAIKVHMGESENTRHVRPAYVRKIVEEVKKLGGDPFVTDTTTLYIGNRFTALNYLETARLNGFTVDTIEAPIIIADGIRGNQDVSVPLYMERYNKKGYNKELGVASLIAEADSMVVVSHAKGHETSGFGGAIKNLGMGCTSKRGKIYQHKATLPDIDLELCNGCGYCEKACSWDAVKVDEKVHIDLEKCTGCGGCVVICRPHALTVSKKKKEEFQVRMAEAALAVVNTFDKDKIGYINFAMEITPFCDCASFPDVPIVPDQGLLVSLDPVAIDKASIDLIDSSYGLKGSMAEDFDVLDEGNRKFFGIHGTNEEVQLLSGEKIGLGSLGYNLVRIKI